MVIIFKNGKNISMLSIHTGLVINNISKYLFIFFCHKIFIYINLFTFLFLNLKYK